MNKRILTFGDIHGQSFWKSNLFGSFEGFENWMRYVKLNRKDEFENVCSLFNYDEIVFIGDYVDSLTVSNEEIVSNLVDLIFVKREYPEKIILLLGNHDYQYIMGYRFTKGYRESMKFVLGEIFKNNLDVFKICHRREVLDLNGNRRKILWSHAGITNKWLKVLKKQLVYFGIDKKNISVMKIDELINLGWEKRLDCVVMNKMEFGVKDKYDNPLWIRPNGLKNDPVKGYDQIVGHTSMKTIEVQHVFNNDIYFINTFEHGDKSLYEFEYLN